VDDDPKLGSINDVMSRAEAVAFTVTISDLQNHNEWTNVFDNGLEYFHMGSVYNNKPSDYYSEFKVDFFIALSISTSQRHRNRSTDLRNFVALVQTFLQPWAAVYPNKRIHFSAIGRSILNVVPTPGVEVTFR